MPPSSRDPHLNASFDRFLFALVGEQENGMPLSVCSVLARLGKDPWAEAGRLAQLPREAATIALTAVFASMTPARLVASDAPGIAARVVLLLPSGGEDGPTAGTAPADPPKAWSGKLVLLLCLLVLAIASVNLFADRGLDPDRPPAIGASPAP